MPDERLPRPQYGLTALPSPRHGHGQGMLVPLPVSLLDPAKIAVLLNRNARQVKDSLARRMERIVGSDNLYYSRSLDEAEGFAREIVQRGYGTVVCGGGDGTLASAMNLIQRYVDEANAWRIERYQRFRQSQELLSVPRFAFLKLGTGNGMTRLVGADAPVADLRRIVEFAPSRTRTIPLIECDDERFFFGGMGYDSALLNDYNWLKVRTKNVLMKWLMHSVAGYFAAAFTRLLPRILMGQAAKLDVRITTHSPAYFVDPRRGDYVDAIEPGSLLYQGPATFLGVGTVPFFGYGMRMFPFSRMMPGMMQLRVTSMGPHTALGRLPSIWTGAYRNPKNLFDFLVQDIRVELAEPFPFQHSGDARGIKDELNLKISRHELRLVDFYPPRLPGRA